MIASLLAIMRVKPHNWANEELTLMHDTAFSVREVAEKLGTRIGTVENKQKALGVSNWQFKNVTIARQFNKAICQLV